MAAPQQIMIAAKIAGGGGGGTPDFVQVNGSSFDPFGTNRTQAFSVSPTPGNGLVAIYSGENADELTVSDNTTTTGNWVLAVESATTDIAIWACPNTQGVATTVTFALGTSNGNNGNIIVMEVVNLATASVVDQTGIKTEFTPNISLTTGVTSQASEFVIGAMTKGGAAPTAGAGFDLRHTQGNLYVETKTVSSVEAQTINFTHAEATASLAGVTLKGN